MSGPDSAASIAAHYGGQRAGAWWRLACPAHGGDGRNLSIRDDVDDRGNPRLRATCHSAGCDWPDIMAAFRADGLHPPDSPDFQRRNAPESDHPATRRAARNRAYGDSERSVSVHDGRNPPQSARNGQTPPETRRNRPQRDVGAPARSGADSGRPDARAVGLLAATVAIPADPDHPARRWLAARALWRPAEDLPPWARWLPADALAAVHGATPPGPNMAGALTVPAAPLAAWIDRPDDWPRRALAGVQLVNIAADGSPAMDAGGLGKRSYGRMAGAVVVFGLIDPAHGATLAEGAADALALAARYRPAAVATLGTAGLAHPDTVRALAGLTGGVTLYPDADRAGHAAAAALAAAIERHGGRLRRADLPDGMDAAALAARQGFRDVDADVLAGWRAAIGTAGLPRWERDRQAYAVALDCAGGPVA